MGEWTNKLWYTPTMKYSDLRRKKILAHVTVWIKLEAIMHILIYMRANINIIPLILGKRWRSSI